MAPINQRSRSSAQNDSSSDATENLWSSIISEVQATSVSKLTNKHLLVLGDDESGKTTLIAKLRGNEELRKGSGVEYNYIDIKNEYREDDPDKLGVWIVDGDPHHTGLLKFAVTEATFEHTLAVIVASMASPWSLVDSVRKWCAVLRDHVDRLRLNADRVQHYQRSLVRCFQEYVEPDDAHPPSLLQKSRDYNPLHPAATQAMEGDSEDDTLLPLGPTTLTHNLGIPIIVVVTKTDGISVLEKQHDYKEEHFDFIQQHLRKLCLNYGAALVYNSVKDEKNCDLLYKYIVHRIYGFPFSSTAYVVEKDLVFVPMGWDNDKKISILYENLNSMKPDEPYEDVIVKPISRKGVQRENEITVEDEQTFLMKQQTLLSKAPAPGAATDSSMRNAGISPKAASTPRTLTSTSSTPSPKKLDTTKGATTSEGVLANFFNSLLTKKTGTPPSQEKHVSWDAAAELDRMNRVKKESAESPKNAPPS